MRAGKQFGKYRAVALMSQMSHDIYFRMARMHSNIDKTVKIDLNIIAAV